MNDELWSNVSIISRLFSMKCNSFFGWRCFLQTLVIVGIRYAVTISRPDWFFLSISLYIQTNIHHFYAIHLKTFGKSMLHYIGKHCSVWFAFIIYVFEVEFAYQLRSTTMIYGLLCIEFFRYGQTNVKRVNRIVFSIVSCMVQWAKKKAFVQGEQIFSFGGKSDFYALACQCVNIWYLLLYVITLMKLNWCKTTSKPKTVVQKLCRFAQTHTHTLNKQLHCDEFMPRPNGHTEMHLIRFKSVHDSSSGRK